VKKTATAMKAEVKTPDQELADTRALVAKLKEMGAESASVPAGAYRHDLALDQLQVDPRNPRKRFDEGALAELAESIRQKGVIQTILVRPTPLMGEGGKYPAEWKPFTIVAGERRYRASLLAGATTIPAVIREMSDVDSFEVMTIENLHREDLTELEQAESYRTYLKEMGDDALPGFAERIGVSAQYVRKRVKVLELPEQVLEAWQEGKLHFGHLEQFLRLPDRDTIMEYFKKVVDWEWSVKSIKERVDGRAPDLHGAEFDKSECAKCAHNSSVQKELFGDLGQDKKVVCHNPPCFRGRVERHFSEHWMGSKFQKKYGTNGVRISEGYDYSKYVDLTYYDILPTKGCAACSEFVTVILPNGLVSEGLKKACANLPCFRAARSKTGTASGTVKKTEEIARDYRERFYMKRIRAQMGALTFDDERALRLILAVITRHEGHTGREIDTRSGGKKDAYGYLNVDRLERIFALSIEDVKAILIMAATEFAAGSAFGWQEHHLLAPVLGIDLGAEWKITEGFLKAHTIAQILGIAGELKILDDEKAKTYLQQKFSAKKFEALKKDQLIELILKCKVDLVGRVPKEVLKVKNT
jgi:ParB family transcriptional regulator, chromosome partitioning protein